MVYQYVQSYLLEHDSSPTIRQIAEKFSTSTRKVLDVLRSLEDKFVIKRSSYISRSIELLSEINEDGTLLEEDVPVKILGTAPGGNFLFAEENVEGEIKLPRRLLKGCNADQTYLLRVTGDSMKPFLDDGDLALVKQIGIQEAQNTDIVVAVRADAAGDYEATIKEFSSTGNQVVLTPLNREKHSPMVFDKQSVGVLGKVIGSIKLSY